MTRAVFFDLDGTLTDYAQMVRHTLAILADRVAEHTGVSRDAFIHTYDEVQREDEAAQRAGALTVTELRDRSRRFGRALTRLSVHDSTLVQALATGYAEARRSTCFAMSGADATLRLLREHGIWVGIITEGSGVEQRGQLARLGWTSLVNDIVISEEAGCHKPDPSLTRLALTHAGAEPGRAVCVGDRALWDLAPAKSLGITTVLFKTDLYRDEADQGKAFIDAAVQSHAELQRWLSNWLSAAS